MSSVKGGCTRLNRKYPSPHPHPPGARNRQNQLRTWVSVRTLRDLTSDPSKHIRRRLMSYLVHQNATTSRSKPTLLVATLCTQYPPREGVKTSKLALYMGVGLNLVGFDIISIDTHHETSSELSRSLGGDDAASRSILPVHKRHSRQYPPPVGTKPLK